MARGPRLVYEDMNLLDKHRIVITIVYIITIVMIVINVLPISYAAGQTPDSGETINVVVNGENVAFPDQQPITVNGRAFVPVRFIAEALYADVEWNPDDEVVLITRGDTRIYMQIGNVRLVISRGDNYKNGGETDSDTYQDMDDNYFNGDTDRKTYGGASDEPGVGSDVELIQNTVEDAVFIDMDVEPFLMNGRSLCPVRYITEALGGTVDWDDETGTVIIEDEYAKDIRLKNNERYVRDRGIYV